MSPIAAPALAGSLIAFVIVYFVAFLSGGYYIVKLMAQPPQPHEPPPDTVPARAAGITPAQAVQGDDA